MTGRSKRIAGIAGVSVLLVGILSAYVVLLSPNHFEGSVVKILLVSRGQSFGSVVDSLASSGVIGNRRVFRLAARLLGEAGVQAGKHVIPNDVSNWSLAEGLKSGRFLKPIDVTVPEGILARHQARLFARHLGADSSRFMYLVFDREFASSCGVMASSLEGYLLPDTYSFAWNQDEEEIVRRMVREFVLFYSDSLMRRQEEMGWTMNQVVTLASIVEAEAVLDNERPVISGVYHNRLRKGMRLEADPTIQFLFPDGPRRVLYADLRIDSPYNTYRYRGLPPGPVNNPGRASIRAALFPARHSYLFFVADGGGGHRFASSYAEHLRFVRMYRRYRAAARTRS